MVYVLIVVLPFAIVLDAADEILSMLRLLLFLLLTDDCCVDDNSVSPVLLCCATLLDIDDPMPY